MEESAAEQIERKRKKNLAKRKKKKILAEEKKKEMKSSEVVPWMRDPLDISRCEEWPVDSLPRLDPRLKTALHKMGITSLFPVQLAIWHQTVGFGFERDLYINSPTGSGKTLAYALPILQLLSTRFNECLRALVVLPTRDLAVQVKEVFAALAPAVGLSVGLAVGQSSIADERSQLIQKPNLDVDFFGDLAPPEPRSAVDILVATPGRLMEHINSTHGFTLEHLHYLVVDEADRLLREAYQNWLPNVLHQVYARSQSLLSTEDGRPSLFGSLRAIRDFVVRGSQDTPYPRLAKMVLSATSSHDPSKLVQLKLHHPLFLNTGDARYQLPEQLKSFKLICELDLKPLYLLALLETLQGEKCIVFTSSVHSTHMLYRLLNFFDGLQTKMKAFSGLQDQSMRSKTLKALREGEIQVLISSDAMARGMDVEGVKYVINYDAPQHINTYIHRAGRTARAGQTGCCITLLLKGQVKKFKSDLQKAGIESCPIYTVPAELLESFHPMYATAKQRLEESVETEKSLKDEVKLKITRGVPLKKEKKSAAATT